MRASEFWHGGWKKNSGETKTTLDCDAEEWTVKTVKYSYFNTILRFELFKLNVCKQYCVSVLPPGPVRISRAFLSSSELFQGIYRLDFLCFRVVCPCSVLYCLQRRRSELRWPQIRGDTPIVSVVIETSKPWHCDNLYNGKLQKKILLPINRDFYYLTLCSYQICMDWLFIPFVTILPCAVFGGGTYTLLTTNQEEVRQPWQFSFIPSLLKMEIIPTNNLHDL